MFEPNVCPASISIRENIVKENIMKMVEANVGRMETELKQWGAKLDKLVAKVEAAGTEVKSDYRQSVEDLRSKYRLTQSKLDELKTAGSAKWGIFKTGVETAWNDLEASFKKLTRHSAGAEGDQTNQDEPESEENI
ncbi:MAG: hypothetical protein ABSB49_08955 [Polyangia bacterium]|jgi:hypothetical protein